MMDKGGAGMISIADRPHRGALRSITDLKTLDRLNLPPAPGKSLLAHLHSGDVLRHTIPKVLKMGAVVGLAAAVLWWLLTWPGIYEQFERWGLVKAFFARMVSLAAACLVARITILRADHLRVLPADDFISLRSFSVLCRWLGEVALVSIVGSAVSMLVQPATLIVLVGIFFKGLARTLSESSFATLLFTVPLSGFLVFVAAACFLTFYAVGASVDLVLAIEVNTRPERRGRDV
jgi:hypothetical protein